MPMQTPAERAKAMGLYVAKVVLNGRHAKDGPAPKGRIGLDAAITSDAAYAFMGLIQVACFGPGTVPDTEIDNTIGGVGRVIADMLIPADKRDDFTKAFSQLVSSHRSAQ